MIEFLSQYSLFLAKSLTFLVVIVVGFACLVSIIQKAKSSSEDGYLVINPINEKIDDIRYSIQSETLSKQEWKKWQKNEKNKNKTKNKSEKSVSTKTDPRLFIINFEGDIRASGLTGLREVVSAIIESTNPQDQDEVLVVLDSAGGFVHSYGLAASQLTRLRDHGLHLTVAIDKVAASGGYLMACVAHRILAAPFAIIGSIGVVAQVPNFHRLLEKHNIDYEQLTAGEYKRTLTLFGENTPKAREKFQEELEVTHRLFKQYIVNHRPQVDIDLVATGEHWHALEAIKIQLIDVIQTSDDYILSAAKTKRVFEVRYEEKQRLKDKIQGVISGCVETLIKKLAACHPSSWMT